MSEKKEEKGLIWTERCRGDGDGDGRTGVSAVRIRAGAEARLAARAEKQTTREQTNRLRSKSRTRLARILIGLLPRVACPALPAPRRLPRTASSSPAVRHRVPPPSRQRFPRRAQPTAVPASLPLPSTMPSARTKKEPHSPTPPSDDPTPNNPSENSKIKRKSVSLSPMFPRSLQPVPYRPSPHPSPPHPSLTPHPPRSITVFCAAPALPCCDLFAALAVAELTMSSLFFARRQSQSPSSPRPSPAFGGV